MFFADEVDSHRAQQELIELLSWVRDRWRLRLSPDDVDAHNESFMDPQAWMAANGGDKWDWFCSVGSSSYVHLPASGDDGDVSMDLTAELAGITDVLEEEAPPRAQAWRLEQTFEGKSGTALWQSAGRARAGFSGERRSLGVARGERCDRALRGAPAGQNEGFSWLRLGGAAAETIRVCSCGVPA